MKEVNVRETRRCMDPDVVTRLWWLICRRVTTSDRHQTAIRPPHHIHCQPRSTKLNLTGRRKQIYIHNRDGLHLGGRDRHTGLHSPEQLRVDERDDVLQQLVGGANQEVRSEGFQDGAQEGRLLRSFLIGQQYVSFLWTVLLRLVSWQVIGFGWRQFGVLRLAGQVLLAAGFGRLGRVVMKTILKGANVWK